MAEKQKFTIREASVDDLKDIYFYWKEGVEQALAMELDPVQKAIEDHYKEEFRQKFDEVDGVFRIWVAEQDEKVIGWQYLMPYDNNPALRNYTAEISTYVAPDYRECGVGTALLQHGADHAKQTPLQYIVGHISEENEAIPGIAERVGFKKCGEFPPPLKDPKHSASHIYIYVVPEE